MWISQRIAKRRDGTKDPADIAEVTIGGAAAAAYSDCESRNLGLVSPGGFFWRPSAGQKVLVFSCGGERVVAGALQEGTPSGMENGEIYLQSGGASIWLKNDGQIVISGDVDIDGTLSVGGASVTPGA